MNCSDGNIVGSAEVVNHIGSSSLVTVVKDIVFRVHVPLDLMNFVSSVGSVVSHDDCSFEFTINEVCIISHSTFFNQSKTMVNREELRDVINDKIKTSLEDPRRCEETWPSLNLTLEDFCLFGHEESRVTTDLSQRRISQTVLDDAVDETKCDWMVFHLGVV